MTLQSTRRYPIRERRPSRRLYEQLALNAQVTNKPTSFSEAVRDASWQAAIDSEVSSILKNRTWEVIDRPSNCTPITAKWIFKLKQVGDSTKPKARIVARGFQQREGIDFHDIFAPVVRWSTIRIILALAARNNRDLHQMDVKTAFLNSILNEEVLMEIPEGFPQSGNPTKVCKIKCALYGLRQAPKAWYSRIDTWFTTQGYKRSQHDPNLYFSSAKKNKFLYCYTWMTY